MDSWFKKPINIAATTGAAALTVVVIILLIWGITHHHEESLLKVCWEQGIARYEKGSTEEIGPEPEGEFCAEPEDLIWPQKQIPISIQPVGPGGRYLDTSSNEYRVLAHAARDLNGQFGFDVLELGVGLKSIDAEVRIGLPMQTGKFATPPGRVLHTKIDDTIQGLVYIRSDVSAVDRTLYLAAQHEFLHLIGLRHDDFESSLMFPITREDWNAESLSSAHVTDHDVELIQKLYKK